MNVFANVDLDMRTDETNQSLFEWYYNRLRPYVTFVRVMFGLHSDFRPIGKPIKDEFVHHIQTEIPALTNWAIGWYDDGLLTAIESLPLPAAKVKPTLARAQK